MSEVPSELSYTLSHEWVRFEAGGVVRVGITDYGQRTLGEVGFVRPPDVGTQMVAGRTAGTIQATRAVAELVSPLSGMVVAVNEALDHEPDRINRDPYGSGWLFCLRPLMPTAGDSLKSAAEYLARIGARA